MIEWKEIRVGDIGRVITGKTPKTSISENYGGSIPFITPSDDMSVKHIYSTNKTLTELGAQSVKNNIIPANTICVSCIGSDLGKVVISTEESVTNQQINSIIVNREKYDLNFIYYVMTELGKVMNHHSKTSTAVPIVNKSQFSEYTFQCPDKETQKKIGKMLDLLDKKIETNDAINRNLSEQADCLFEEWIKSCDSEISIGDMADNIIDYNVGEHKQVVLVNSSDVTEGHFEHHNLSENVDLKGHFKKAFKKWDILYSEIRPRNKHYAYCQFDPDGYIASTRLMIIRNKPEMVSSSMLYQYLMLRNVFEEFTLKTESRSGTFPQGRYEDMAAIKVPYSIDNQEEVASALDSIYAILWKNEVENRRLSGLRDSLLPKLMSGELDVSDLEI